MRVEWAGLSPEILLPIDRKAHEPLRVQLEVQLRNAIRSGRLGAGERLPSSRVLARELGLSRGLVQECYAQLLAEGFLVARSGAGTSVSSGACAPVPDAARRIERISTPRIDFRLGSPDLASFPRQDWMWAMREASRTVAASDLGYGDPRGSRRLREVLAAYLRRVRGALADPESIVVCAGFAQGMYLLLNALRRDGVECVAFEDPGHSDDRETVAFLGAKPIPVPVDQNGVEVRALARSRARAAILTPAHQSPTGVVLSPERRRAIVAWAQRQDATIIEDDYDSEFRYDREPVGALQGFAPHTVALVGTVSKSLSPSLRLGWIVCPPRMLDAVMTEKHRTDRGSPVLEQLALATLIESGRFDKHLRRMRRVYSARRQALIDALALHAPGVRVTGLAAGMHAVAHLPEGLDEHAVATAARERSVGVYPLGGYRLRSGAFPPQLALGFGNLSESSIRRGIAAIGDLLAPREPT